MIKRLSAEITTEEQNMFAGLARMMGLTVPKLTAILIRDKLKKVGLLRDIGENELKDGDEIDVQRGFNI